MSRYLGNYEKAKSRNRGQKKVKNSIPKARKTFQGDNCKNTLKPGGRDACQDTGGVQDTRQTRVEKDSPRCLRIKLLIYVGENAGMTWRPTYWAHCTSNKKHGTQHAPEVRTLNSEVA